ncbi:MAG: DUF3105 domain-containing protein [Polyangiaceae bacterium]
MLHRASWLRTTASVSFLSIPALAAILACGSTSTTPEPSSDAGVGADDRARPKEPIIIDAGACKATLTAPPLLEANHVEVGTQVEYNSNPPSSGPHYSRWAAFREYETPVDRRYYVHDLEHGAVVLAYKCATAAECPEIVAELRKVVANIKTDPLCTDGVRVRYVMTPDPLLNTKVAIAAWGFTYNADCVDVPTLSAFANQNYGRAPEDFCTEGITTF